MRAGQGSLQVSLGALALAMAMMVPSGSGYAQSTSNAAIDMPPPVATNWPPAPPPMNLDSKTEPTAPAAPPVAANEPAKAELPKAAAAKPDPAAPATAEAPKPAFTLGAEIAARLKADKSDAAKADRDGAAKAYEKRNGAPVWVTEKGFTDQAVAVMAEIRNADSYGLPAQAFRLPQQTWSVSAAPSPAELADAEVTLTLAALKYARFARGGRLDPVALSPTLDRKPVIAPPDGVLEALAAATKPAEALRGYHPKHPQFERLRLKYVAVRSGQSVLPPPPAAPAQPEPEVKGKKGQAAKKAPATPAQPTPEQLERKLLANMEMWRWMPDMGDTFVQNNIPEFLTRMYRGGKLVHVERIVVGKPETPTVMFSDEFDHVVFKPFWNVPESIKWKELQPQLERNPGALARVGLRASYNGKEVDPASVNWTQTDLRAFHVFQPPGAGNALGTVKFMFPNKHDIYMHDTPHKNLFNNPVRAYSHGCMRVRDPLKFAEMLVGHDKGWSVTQIRQLMESGPDNNEVKLTRKLPIHVTYFTTHVDDDGTLKLFHDLYGHEQKVHLGLEGKAHLIRQPQIVAERAPPRRSNQLVQNQTSIWGGPSSKSNPFESWMKNVFNF